MRWWWVVAVTTMVVGCSETNDGKGNLDQQASGAMNRDWPERPREAVNVFYSGHSLMDQPLPDFVEQISRSLNTQIQWNRQYVVGSSIQRRTEGPPPVTARWAGYRQGFNRDGTGLDVIAELKKPATIPGVYDTLVITEEHSLLDIILIGDTVRQLRHYHDRFIAGNAAGQTHFYLPWLDIQDKSEPSSWIRYERAAAPIWQCVVTRVNVSLEHEGRADRIATVPTSLALVDLIERATSGGGLPSISRGSVFETVDSIVKDTVHLQDLGIYYAALVTYASIYQRSPVGAWHPESVTNVQAASLQELAWNFLTGYYQNNRPLSLEQCRALLLSDKGLVPLWGYMRDVFWRKHDGALRSYVRYQRRLMNSRRVFGSRSAENPFYFDPETDSAYWLPAP